MSRSRKGRFRLLPILFLLGLALPAPAGAQSAGDSEDASPETVVHSIRIDGAITTVTLDYLERALSTAEEAGSEAFLIELDTPGGSVDAMLSMGGRMLNAELPTLVWVGPQGAQAASAGTFIVLAGHAAGMAPRTTIGAASPVGPGGEDLPETVGRKITEDLSATARNYAERRGPEAVEWAELAVREAASATADEALELGVIDAVADSPEALLEALDGLEVDLAGRSPTLQLSPATIRPIPTTSAEDLLALLANPALALILLTIGVNAILAELSNPGGYVAGIIGILALALALYSLGALEANWIGLGFLAASFILFALELKTPTTGIFTLGGIALFVAGAVILFAGGGFAIPWATIIGLALATAAFFLFAVRAALRAMRRQPTTGSESLIGARAELRRLPTDQAPGTVLVAGELWDARWAPDTEPAGVRPGDRVTIRAREGYTLVIVSD